jgi:hypothetical protein
MQKSQLILPRVVLTIWLVVSCSSADSKTTVVQSGKAPDPDGRLFTALPSSFTGVRFENRIQESQDRNVFTYRNFYNGGGVAIGDLTGDGLPEIALTSNQQGPRLFLNDGDFRFRDVTQAARLKTAKNSWTTGILFADVNGDGRLDIYVCRAGPLEPERRGNELWMNQGVDANGVPTFREMAPQYGVADRGYSTHAAFLDYDRDGDLDLFVVNNSPRPASSFGVRNARHVRDPYGTKLYRNDGARFVDASVAAGIHSPEVAFGLGIAVGDVNRDGWPDVYIANDFFERDYLYVNKGNGTFTEALDRQMPVMSYFSMGLDIADVDNDGWPEVYTTDMLPEDEYRLKTTTMFEGWDVYQRKVENGYHHQLMRNMLQRNNRDGTFSDVGEMAGVARTDWSWSALIADLDLDGWKDIYVTNGLAKDITSQDYVAFLANEETMKEVTTGKGEGGRRRVDFERLTDAMTTTPLADFAFRNEGGLRFSNATAAWGLDTANLSNGAAYGDLDGDGALDLVVNNVNQEALVYRNNSRTLYPGNGYVRTRLEGADRNRFAVGARVTLYAGNGAFMQEQAPARGFQSSVDYVLVFGLGKHTRADSLRVEWPDGRVTLQRDVAANQLVTVRQSESAQPSSAVPVARIPRSLMTEVTQRAGLHYVHKENEFNDFDRERLIPKMLSTEGPHIAVADVNGDGLDDVFIGGAKEQPRQLLIQQQDGKFIAQQQRVFDADLASEDIGAVFFDANGDGSPDLYVVSGGNEFSDRSPALQDRLYLNDGGGNFRKAEGHLPTEYASGSRVVPADYDGDGDVDLFVGGRVVPWRYGISPRSALLRNDGRGHFADVTERLAPELAETGMVTDAVWQDVDGDRRLDLVVVGEWMPIRIFRNAGAGKLQPNEVRGLQKSHGWWNRIVAGDFTGDGRVDFIVGNLGLNSRLRASEARPTTMHVGDFDRNGFVEQIVSCYSDSVSYPLPLRDDLIKSLPYLKARFLNYKDYALKTVADIFPEQELASAHVLKAHTFATTFVRSNPDGSYTMEALPLEAQAAPVYGVLADDLDADGDEDLLLAGNFDGFKPEIGRMSAGRGLVLRGDGKGHFTAVHSGESGFVVPGQARDIKRLRAGAGRAPQYVVTRNNDRALVFERAAGRNAANGELR